MPPVVQHLLFALAFSALMLWLCAMLGFDNSPVKVTWFRPESYNPIPDKERSMRYRPNGPRKAHYDD